LGKITKITLKSRVLSEAFNCQYYYLVKLKEKIILLQQTEILAGILTFPGAQILAGRFERVCFSPGFVVV
jgi:hypothetical protein